MTKGGKRGRKKARAAKYTLGMDIGTTSGDFSAYVVSRQDPVTKAVEIIASRTFPAISEEARAIIRDDLEAFGFQIHHHAGGSES